MERLPLRHAQVLQLRAPLPLLLLRGRLFQLRAGLLRALRAGLLPVRELGLRLQAPAIGLRAHLRAVIPDLALLRLRVGLRQAVLIPDLALLRLRVGLRQAVLIPDRCLRHLLLGVAPAFLEVRPRVALHAVRLLRAAITRLAVLLRAVPLAVPLRAAVTVAAHVAPLRRAAAIPARHRHRAAVIPVLLRVAVIRVVVGLPPVVEEGNI